MIDTSSLHSIQLADGTTSTQRCIFTYFPVFDQVFVGTMFESFSLANNHNPCEFYVTSDPCKASADNANYNDFRWSYSRLLSQFNSISDPYLFTACNGQASIGNSYSDGNDHILLMFDSRFITTPFVDVCFAAKSINIRNRGCADTEIQLWQRSASIDSIPYHFHIDSSHDVNQCGNHNVECTYNTGAVHSEDNFGFYHTTNSQHQCTQSSSSTTNYYIGSIFNMSEPTSNPTTDPTPSPTFKNCNDAGEIKSIEWSQITTDNTQIPYSNYSVIFNENSLELMIDIDLEYLGTSQDGLGTTYVIDFQSFSSTEDRISEPGNCQNRLSSSFDAIDFSNSWGFRSVKVSVTINDFCANL